jgi:predicted lipoprotein with Yx(FWY)xxD motif
MPRTSLIAVVCAGAAALAIAGCGGGDPGSTASSGSASSSGAKPLVTTAKSSIGSALVDGSGRTLYRFAKDAGPKSTCSGACAANWPPFTATSKPQLGGGIAAGELSLVARGDGKRQVAIDGHPLYRFAGDRSAGQANGQGVDAFGATWSIVGPAGKALTGSVSSIGSSSSSSSSSGSSSSSSRNGYGY